MDRVKGCFISFRNYAFHVSDSIITWAKSYGFLFLIYLVIGLAVFFMLISQDLVTSFDGVWHNSSFNSGRWELSLGRWFLPFLDRSRFGLVSISLNSFLTLIMVAFGNVLLIDLFQVKNRFSAILAGALFIATPLICDSLSYCYTSTTYGSAYLLGVATAYCTLKIQRTGLAVITGAWFLSWTMGSYQAYFGVTCIVLLVYCIKRLFQDTDKKAVGNIIIRVAGIIAVGGILYTCIVSIANAVFHVELSTYRGTNDISLMSIITNLPRRIPEAYKEFYDYFFVDANQSWIFYLKCIYTIAFFITAIILLCKVIDVLRKNLLNGILCVLAILAIPLACNGIVLLITSASSLLMAGGMALLFPLFLCLFDDFMNKKLLYSVYLLVLTGMLWINICIVNNDQISLRDGRTSTVTIAQNIVTTLVNNGYIGTDNVFAFIGRPSNNIMFYRSAAYEKASPYAKFGDWWRASDANRCSWDGVFTRYCGVEFNFCEDDQYEELIKQDEIKDMPCYPENGSIGKVDGVVVVKVSDSY